MILALDIGGTAVKLGLVDEEGTVHARGSADVSFDGYRTPVFTTAVRAADAFLQAHQTDIGGIAVSATGQVETDTGIVVGTNGKIPNYEGTNLKAGLEAAFGKESWALNDANAAVLGECFTGAARGLKDVLMVTLGTGVGGGVVTGGRLLEGRRGIGGELGHMPLRAGGPPCPCGLTGCYESYASVTALVRRCEEASGLSGLDGRRIFRLVSEGNRYLANALNGWIRDVAAGLCGLVHLFNPEMVLVGGGVSTQEDLLIRPLREAVLSQVMPRFREGLRLERASLGNDAGIVGAVRFWLDRHQSA